MSGPRGPFCCQEGMFVSYGYVWLPGGVSGFDGLCGRHGRVQF